MPTVCVRSACLQRARHRLACEQEAALDCRACQGRSVATGSSITAKTDKTSVSSSQTTIAAKLPQQLEEQRVRTTPRQKPGLPVVSLRGEAGKGSYATRH